jgi:beta-galactosidase/beta-glucuronidase
LQFQYNPLLNLSHHLSASLLKWKSMTMKTLIYLTLLLFSIATVFGQVSFGEAVKLNDGWKFQKGDVKDASQPSFNDSKWRQLDLPHDWSVEGPLSPSLASATGYRPGGIAWYRKTLEIPTVMKNKKVFIYFEGIYRNGQVFVNGTSLGIRPNGYVSYTYDITPQVRFGEMNTIAVRVDHSKSADSRWYTGSGIYRDVYLIYANSIHIDLWGVYCTTPQVNDRQAILQVQTSLQNSTPQSAQVTVVQKLLDKDNTSAGKVMKTTSIDGGKSALLAQEIKVNQPKLWSLESPHLYLLTTSVYRDQELLDSSTINVGIRTLRYPVSVCHASNLDQLHQVK